MDISKLGALFPNPVKAQAQECQSQVTQYIHHNHYFMIA